MSVSRLCSVCRWPESRPLLLDEGRPVVRCTRCGFIYCDPIPELSVLADYYTQSYDDWDAWETTFRHDRSLVMRAGLTEIRRLRPGGRLLDVGCSLGFFLEAARQGGYEVAGVDLSRTAAAFARERLRLDVRACALEDAHFAAGRFDIVTLWDVLEHLPDPAGTLGEIHRVLQPGGLLVVRVPNAAFHLPKTRLVQALAPRSFIGLDARNHLNHYTPVTLRQALSGAGFALDRLKAGPVNLYGKPLVDTLKVVYARAAAAVHNWTGVMAANIMEAYASRVP